MMAEIKVSIEGKGSKTAAESLFEIADLQGNWETVNLTPTKDGGVLAIIATIVGIVGTTLAVAEQIRQWYLQQKKAQKKLENVVLVAGDTRVVLENATVDDIRTVLEALED